VSAGSALQNVHQLRRAVPVRLAPALVRARLDRIWSEPAFRSSQEAEMRFLLEHTDRAGEVGELAYRHAEHMMMRGYLRWHPRAITRQPVRGIEWLTTRRDPARGVLLSFTHHHSYDGLFGSLARYGVRSQILITPEIAKPEAGIAFRQHLRVAARGGEIVPAVGGTEQLAARLRPGTTLALAPDFPGRTPVTFLGRKVLGSFGTARIATLADSPVVLVTQHQDPAGGSYVQVHPPLESRDFSEPRELLDEVLGRHGEAILAWPEALEAPTARFGHIDE
jgi:hypothetical protein